MVCVFSDKLHVGVHADSKKPPETICVLAKSTRYKQPCASLASSCPHVTHVSGVLMLIMIEVIGGSAVLSDTSDNLACIVEVLT